MSNFVWCHGPSCHTQHTQDRIRGVKGSKVLRTKKVAQDRWNSGIDNEGNDRTSMYSYFCSNGCYNDFAKKHIERVIAIAPRTTPLETPVEVTKEKVTSRWNSDHTYVETRITRVDNNGG